MPHGHEVSIPVPGRPEPLPAYAAVPAAPRRGVVVLHELWGRAPEMDRVVDRFAERGYGAVEPVLFHSVLSPRCVRQAVQLMRTGQGAFADQVRAARAWLCERTGLAPGQVGLIGFCMGGGFALALGQGWGAVSTNYGQLPDPALLKALPPTIGCYGGKDRFIGPVAPKLRAALEASGTPVETHTYPDAGHSFLTDGHHPVATVLTWPVMHLGHVPAAAEDAWGNIFRFFDQHLA